MSSEVNHLEDDYNHGFDDTEEYIPPDPYKGRFFFVNVYTGNKSYGGPEEGGWWYDTGEFIRCILVTRDRLRAERARAKVRSVLNRWNTGLKPKHSVLCSGVYEVQIDKHPGHDYPVRRPYYE